MNGDYEYDPKRVVYFGATDARNRQIPFGIRANDRMRHMYVVGKTGMGKSTLLENLAIQDIQNGEGLCFIDPHGGTAEKLLEFVPESRIDDVVYFAPFDIENPLGFNVMEDVGSDKRHLVVAGLMSSFKRIWVDMWSARMEYILQNVLLALLEYPDTTLIDVNRMLINKEFRKKVVEYVTDPIVKRFWVEEFAGYGDRYTQEATPAIQNKIGQFASNPLVRNIIAQPKSTFNIREIMDNRKIFIVNLSKGRMGEQNADLLGSMLVTKMYLSAMSRAEETPAGLSQLPPFYLYVDEFQSVVNDSFANILSEARKYKLSLTIAHQYIEQVDEEIRAAVFGNVGTTITFRVGPFDAETLKTIFEPTFYVEDIVNLWFAQIYLTLMIDGIGSKPFSAKTLPPVEDPPRNFVDQIVQRSREQFSRSRIDVEQIIRAQDEKLPPGGFEKPASPWAKKKKKSIPNNSNNNTNTNQQTKKTTSPQEKPKVPQKEDQKKEVLKKPQGGRNDLRSALAAIVKPVSVVKSEGLHQKPEQKADTSVDKKEEAKKNKSHVKENAKLQHQESHKKTHVKNQRESHATPHQTKNTRHVPQKKGPGEVSREVLDTLLNDGK